MSNPPPSPDDRIPVTVVTGYLGAGKTTLVNQILLAAAGRRFAVIVNEFGDIGIDGELIQSGTEELIELASGCICCVVRGDLIRTLRHILSNEPNLDGILIETTGLANPSPVIQTLVIDQVISAQCRLDSVVTVVDTAHITIQLSQSQDAADQIAFSDHVVLNKIDVAATNLSQIETTIQALNPFAQISRAQHGKVPLGELLDRHGFDLDAITLPTAEPPSEHTHTAGISSVSLTDDQPLDAGRLDQWLQDLLARHGSDILRTKGILSILGEDRRLVLQAVNMTLEGEYLAAWNDNARSSKIVFIGRNLDRAALATGFHQCRAQNAA